MRTPGEFQLSPRAISFHPQDGDNRWRPYRRPDGSLLAYNHDVVLRKTSEGTPDYSDPVYCPVLWRPWARTGSARE